MTAETLAITAANRRGWNHIAHRRPGQPAAFFHDGGGVLEPYEIDLAGDVTGKRLLHLACSMGDEVLSWANRGAIVTGVDISDVAIGIARAKAAEAGVAADFRQADILALPPDLADFDLIYFSWGAICWVPDLDFFTAMIAERLRPGGALLAADHHPLWEILGVTGENRIRVNGNYFGRTTPDPDNDPDKRPIGARDEPDAPPLTAFVWPISDVVMSLVRAGLRLEEFIELPEPSIYPGLGVAAARIPAIYVIKATRP